MDTMKQLKLWSLMLLAGSIMTFSGCNDDDDGPAAIEIVSATATGTDLATGNQVTEDLNAATASTNVPPDAVITVSFTREVDATTVTATSITLNNGSTDVAIAVSASGSNVTVTPSVELERGTNYILTVSASLAATDGGTFTTASRTFKTAGIGVVDPPKSANQVAYWKFDGNADDNLEIQTTVLEEVSYAENRFGEVSSAASFDGDGNIVEIEYSSDLITPNQTVTVWYKVDVADYDGSRFMFGMATERGYFNEIGGGLGWFKYATNHTVGTNPSNNGPFGTAWTDPNGDGATDSQVLVDYLGSITDLVDGNWVMLAMTTDAAGLKTIYLNGVIMMQVDLNNNVDWPLEGLALNDTDAVAVGLNSNLGIGWACSSTNLATGWANYAVDKNNNRTYKGLLDDMRVFNVALTQSEITTLYNDEKP
jgi:hypothetical protein